MGFFERFRKRELEQEEAIEPQISDALLRAFLNQETITREKALTLPSVSGAVDFISNSVASMPVRLYKIRDGRVKAVEDDTRVKLLNGDTGDTLNAYQMKKAMVEDYLLGKGGYMYIRRDRNEVTGLFYVEDIYISILKNYKPIFKDYVILVQGNQYQPWEFVKLLRNTKDGASGRGVIEEVSKALETAYQTLLYQLQLVQTGGSKRGFIKSQRKLGQEEINVLKQAWKDMYAGSDERVVVLNNGLEFQEASSSSVEMQLNESKRTLQDEINGIFHIHPENFELTFKEAIYPIVKAFETALNRDLLLEKEKKNHFFELDVKEIVRASLSERYAAYKLAKETGFMTLNEIRRAENMEYVEGLDVVNVGLGAVLYDTNLHRYYTPNTDTFSQQTGADENTTDADIQHLIMDKELDTAFEESGNSAEREQERFNPNHDGNTGRFAPNKGGGGKDSIDKSSKVEDNTDASVSAKGTNELRVKGFPNKQKLNNHWQNGRTHMSEYAPDGITTKEQYERRGVELAESAADDITIFGYKTKEGHVCRYDIGKNDYVKADVNKGLRTLFKPAEGMSYYQEMLAKEGIEDE